MDPEQLKERLSRISTLWALVDQACAGEDATVAAARKDLLQRYCGAVYYYLLGAVRDEDAAIELFQEFALHFLRGDFQRADANRGRFRDYLKTSLIHLITDYYRAQKRNPHPLPVDVPAPSNAPADAENALVDCWREELISRAWAALAKEHPAYFDVLLFQAGHPAVPASQLAVELNAVLGKSFTAGALRVTLYRARERFAELLLQEVRTSLVAPTQEELVQELHELRLFKLCASAVKRQT